MARYESALELVGVDFIFWKKKNVQAILQAVRKDILFRFREISMHLEISPARSLPAFKSYW